MKQEGTFRLVASKRRAIAIWIASIVILLGTLAVSTVIRQLGYQGPISDYAFVVGAFFGGSLGMLYTLALLKTEKLA